MDLSGFPSLLRPRVPPLHSDLLLEILASGCDPAVVFRIEKNVNLPVSFLGIFLANANMQPLSSESSWTSGI